MRIVAGSLKGRAIVAPEGQGTRPTSDRARQAVFNVLEHAAWSEPLEGARVLDLFAGSGALGFEAISRGAAFALFVETDDAARGAIRENADAWGLMGRTRVHRRSAVDLGVRPGSAGEAFDLVLTCGGVSAGEKDHLPALLQRRGRVHFWKVRMRPGMPVLFADGGSLGPALFLCLPGNPVSVLATCLAVARPLLDGLQGRAPRRPWRARLSASWDKPHERLEFLRGRLASDEEGVLWVAPDPADGSHRLRAAAAADALIVLAPGARAYPAGSVVEVVPY